ncbi:uncharacterized protein [Eurosta solidaginis]|uniref:uncharacterized protein n=1 Tax=Eurosta solidaginis TaxID=178769 RepID=UPI003530FE4A
MATKVLAIIIAVVCLKSNANGNEHSLIHDTYEQLKDNTISKWDDLHNEIRQGDAITYELGTPKYEILNPNEPLEIITAGQPGYYESLRRYEQDAERGDAISSQAINNKDESTQTAPEEAIEARSNEGSANQIPQKGKKIKFIILNAPKRDKSSKLYLGMTKADAQHIEIKDEEELASNNQTSVESTEYANESNNYTQIEEEDQSSKKYEALDLKNSIGSRELNDINSQKSNTTTDQPSLQSADESTCEPTTESATTNFPNATTEATAYQDVHNASSDEQAEAVPNIPKPIEQEKAVSVGVPLNSPPLFLAFGTSMSDMMGSLPNEDAEMTYRVLPQTPPHIRDFDYLYRSALAST